MDGKHRRHERAAPQSAGHLAQNEEQQDDRCGVQQDIGEMIPAGVETVELIIRHE